MVLPPFKPDQPTATTLSASFLRDVQVGNILIVQVDHVTRYCPVSTLWDNFGNIYQRGTTEKIAPLSAAYPFATRWRSFITRGGRVTVFATALGSPPMQLAVEEHLPEATSE